MRISLNINIFPIKQIKTYRYFRAVTTAFLGAGFILTTACSPAVYEETRVPPPPVYQYAPKPYTPPVVCQPAEAEIDEKPEEVPLVHNVQQEQMQMHVQNQIDQAARMKRAKKKGELGKRLQELEQDKKRVHYED